MRAEFIPLCFGRMQLRIRVVMLVIAFAALRASATKFEATDPSTAEFPDAAEPFCLVEYNDGHQEDVCAKEAAEQAELHKKILAHKGSVRPTAVIYSSQRSLL